MVNKAAGALFACDPDDALGRRCWGIVGLQTQDGKPLCRARCCARGLLAADDPCVRQRARRVSASGVTQELDVFSMKVEADGRSWGVLHLFSPVEPDQARQPVLPAPGATNLKGLSLLTRREKEILRALAAGRSTHTIAEDCFISTVTVRNHIRSILKKLQVNKRLEAVLVWMSQFR
jgi:DNA-binding CsgD family transcriptional regulator